jgi:hypothetical protein
MNPTHLANAANVANVALGSSLVPSLSRFARAVIARAGAVTALTVVGVLGSSFVTSVSNAQNGDVIRPYLRKLEYYKYSNISLFEADAAAQKRFREKFTPTPVKGAAVEQAEQDCPTADDIKKKIKNRQAVPQNLIEEAPQECDIVKTYYKTAQDMAESQIGKVYIVTEKYADGTEPIIIGVIAIKSLTPTQAADPEAVKGALNAPVNVFDVAELRGILTQEKEKSNDPNNPGDIFVSGSIESTSYANMWEYLKAGIKQTPNDKVSSIRPSQNVAMKINKEISTKMLSEDAVDKYMAITEGEPHKTGENEKTFTDEIVLGLADYYSWRHYGSAQSDAEPTGLPSLGVELRGGLEDLGFPSLWSERWTASVLWEGQKLGVILPTSLWNTQVMNILVTPRRFTSGLAGAAANFDFPFKLIDKSGVFNVGGSYLFGNDNVLRTEGIQGYDTTRRARAVAEGGTIRDYLIRAHGQVDYTFAIAINDPDREAQAYYIRFKIGAAGYLVDNWEMPLQTSETVRTYRGDQRNLTRRAEFRGDALFRVEFMGTGLAAPFGSYVQYFDGALSGNAWLQVPISDTGFFTGIRGECKLFAPVTRSPLPWEAPVVIMPAVRFIFRW